MKTKRGFNLLLCAALVFALLSTAAHAEGTPTSLSVQEGNIEISAAGTYVISGTTTLYTIKVDENAGNEDSPVNVVLDNVDIELPYSGGCAFSIGAGSYVNLTLRGNNTLTSGSDYAGLCVPSGATLYISEDSASTDTDSLSATSGNMNSGGKGAGIGGNGGTYVSSGGDCGTVTVSSGKVTANGSSDGAGIGGGAGDTRGGNGGAVTISGGTVIATGSNGAGIGGGNCLQGVDDTYGGGGGTVTISGGTVTAASTGFGAGIGGGGGKGGTMDLIYGGSGGTVTIRGGSVAAAGGGGIGGVGVGGAGIGGGYGRAGSAATISGGTVTATGGGGGAGIGGGFSGNGGTVTISGGTITATGGVGGDGGVGIEGAGIGGGYGGNGGAVCISGGSIHATAGSSAQTIGKGQNGSDSGTLQNNGTDAQDVYLTTVTLPGITERTTVSSLKAVIGGTGYSYGFKDTDSDGKLYLYLPLGACSLQMKADTYSYAASLTVDSTEENTVTANDLSSTNITIDTAGTYVLAGSTTSNKIVVNGGTKTEPVNITLGGVSIDLSSAGGCAFELQNHSFVNLTLADGKTNTLKSGTDYAGLQVPDGTALTIGGTGSMSATGNGYGAGIGGNDGKSGGTITINGGSVTAECNGSAGSCGAGIGGGHNGNGGIITINGGYVTAKCNSSDGNWGAGIGGGMYGSGGIITINGGTITAKCCDGNYFGNCGAGIGGGASGDGGTITIKGGNITASCEGSGAGIGGGGGGNGGAVYISGGSVYASNLWGISIGAGLNASDSGTLQNNSSAKAPVYLTTMTLRDTAGAAVGNTLVSSLIASLNNSAYTYGTRDMQTDSEGKLYLYLPENTATIKTQAAENNYVGSVTTTSDAGASLGALTLSSVSGVTPERTNAPVSGSIVITFIGAMDPSVTGTVSLNGGAALAGGTWSDGNTVYTVPYSGFLYSTAYTVAVSGFQNAVGNTITADSTHGFTTCAAPSYSGTVYYMIKSTAGTGGSISPSGSVSVADGGDKTYTITASDGYEIEDVLVDGVSVGTVGSYTFENVKKAHTITASFAEKKVVNPFTDVENGDWFYDSVMYEYKNGLMNGTASDTFSPNGGMTRGMFVTVLYRLSGDTGSYSGGFTDVPLGKWYENAVVWASKNGIAGGIGDNKFAPDAGITREQLAVILYRYAKYKGYDVSAGEDTNILSYQDAFDILDYAYSALQWACGAGIINGNKKNLNPNGPASRAEVAAMLQRFVENVTK